MSKARVYLALLAGVIGLGLLSRLIPTDNVIIGKYLGDALYAAMAYLILALLMDRLGRGQRFSLALLLMIALELFQRTQIPLGMRRSDHAGVRLLAALLGTVFSWFDLAAYLIGLVIMVGIDRILVHPRPQIPASTFERPAPARRDPPA
jgi:hypothetical protein